MSNSSITTRGVVTSIGYPGATVRPRVDLSVRCEDTTWRVSFPGLRVLRCVSVGDELEVTGTPLRRGGQPTMLSPRITVYPREVVSS